MRVIQIFTNRSKLISIIRHLSADEYAYYALVTDDVKTVDPDKLVKLLADASVPYDLRRNLYILIAALRFSRAETKAEKDNYHALLGLELGRDMPASNSVRPAYLNLAGIH